MRSNIMISIMNILVFVPCVTIIVLLFISFGSPTKKNEICKSDT